MKIETTVQAIIDTQNRIIDRQVKSIDTQNEALLAQNSTIEAQNRVIEGLGEMVTAMDASVRTFARLLDIHHIALKAHGLLPAATVEKTSQAN